jgi:hypothetical protein
MAIEEREVRAAQNQLVFRAVNDRIRELGEKILDSVAELDFACECENSECVEMISMPVADFAAIEEVENQFIVLRGHEVPEVEDTVAEHDGFLIVSKRGAGAEFVKAQS